MLFFFLTGLPFKKLSKLYNIQIHACVLQKYGQVSNRQNKKFKFFFFCLSPLHHHSMPLQPSLLFFALTNHNGSVNITPDSFYTFIYICDLCKARSSDLNSTVTSSESPIPHHSLNTLIFPHYSYYYLK